jgi:hypothetical protein
MTGCNAKVTTFVVGRLLKRLIALFGYLNLLMVRTFLVTISKRCRYNKPNRWLLSGYLQIRLWLQVQLSFLRAQKAQGQTEFALIMLVVVLVVIVVLTVFGLVLYKYWDDLVVNLPF